MDKTELAGSREDQEAVNLLSNAGQLPTLSISGQNSVVLPNEHQDQDPPTMTG